MSDKRKVIADGMKELGLNYAFMEWNKDPVYPYFTGEYQESEPYTEDGLQESTFILNGFSRSSIYDLEKSKDAIAAYFHPISGKTAMAADGSAIAVFYGDSFYIREEDAELKRIQINLTVKEWKVM